MLWYAVIIALLFGAGAFLLTRDSRRALRIGGFVLAVGVVLALVLTYSGLMGG